MVGSVALQSLYRISAFNLNDLDRRKTLEACPLLTSVSASSQQFKHRDNGTCHDRPCLGTLPKVERPKIPLDDVYEDIGIDERSKFGRHDSPGLVSTFARTIDHH
jgi:hypothetical protein